MGSGELARRHESPNPRSHSTAQTYGGRDVSAGRAVQRKDTVRSSVLYRARHLVQTVELLEAEVSPEAAAEDSRGFVEIGSAAPREAEQR